MELDNNLLKSNLDKLSLNKFVLLDKVDSTNNYAKNINDDNIIVIAKEQFNGRGRFGREWISESNKNLTFTIKKNFDDTIPSQVINFYTAYIITKYLNDSGFKNATIKWPNDILINHKKVCGILLEKRKNTYYIGIGLNVNQINFQDPIKNVISLKALNGNDHNLNNCLTEIIKLFCNHLYLVKKHEFEKIFILWKEKLDTIRNKVCIEGISYDISEYLIDGSIKVNVLNTVFTYVNNPESYSD